MVPSVPFKRLAALPLLGLLCVASVAVAAPTQRMIKITRSTEGTSERLTPLAPVPFVSGQPPADTDAILTVNETTRYQTMLGFGGAFTDSAAWVLTQLKDLNETKYDEVMDMYFGPDGLQYTFGRVPIGACDFTIKPEWSYDEVKDDVTLSKFSLDNEIPQRLPWIKDAVARRRASGVKNFKILGSPWSAPGWMKTNGAMICGLNSAWDGCQLKSDPSIQQAYAYYFAKWVNAYRAEGLPVWGVTVQNEPQINLLTYEGMVFTPQTEAAFIADYLGPTLEKEAPNTNILILDHNKDKLPDWTNTIYATNAAKYVWGAAVHWYTGDHFDLVGQTYAKYPGKGILATEATDVGDSKAAPEGGTWHLGERYSHDMIGDFNNGVVGWIDWNLGLDRYSGPMHIGPLLVNISNSDSMLIVDLKEEETYFQTLYYHMGQFSKFIPEGSQRIGHTLLPGARSNNVTLEISTFLTPAHETVVVILNEMDVAYNVTVVDGGEYAILPSPAHSVQTLVFDAPEGTDRTPVQTAPDYANLASGKFRHLA